MKKLLPLLLILCCLTSCKKTDNDGPTAAELAELARQDSLALHVAIYPSEGCLPFYFAEATGIYDSLGVDVRFLHLNAMEDCDTALIRHSAEVAASDIARLICQRKERCRLTAIATLPSSLQFYTAKSKRLKNIKQLKERLIALERHSESEYWSEKLTADKGLSRLDVFRTQFNKHKLRQEMLTNGLVDAAFLDQPFANLAQKQGAKRLWTRSEDDPSWSVLAIQTATINDQRRVKQIEALIEGYNLAVEQLNAGTLQTKSDSILTTLYDLPKDAVDTLPELQPKTFGYQALKPVMTETVDAVKAWLTNVGWISAKLSTDSLNWRGALK